SPPRVSRTPPDRRRDVRGPLEGAGRGRDAAKHPSSFPGELPTGWGGNQLPWERFVRGAPEHRVPGRAKRPDDCHRWAWRNDDSRGGPDRVAAWRTLDAS